MNLLEVNKILMKNNNIGARRIAWEFPDTNIRMSNDFKTFKTYVRNELQELIETKLTNEDRKATDWVTVAYPEIMPLTLSSTVKYKARLKDYEADFIWFDGHNHNEVKEFLGDKYHDVDAYISQKDEQGLSCFYKDEEDVIMRIYPNCYILKTIKGIMLNLSKKYFEDKYEVITY